MENLPHSFSLQFSRHLADFLCDILCNFKIKKHFFSQEFDFLKGKPSDSTTSKSFKGICISKYFISGVYF